MAELSRQIDELKDALREGFEGAGDSERMVCHSVATGLEERAMRTSSRRRLTEDRWYQDALQYAGRYDGETLSRIRRSRTTASEIFVNITRPKTKVLRNRIAETVMPTDKINWDIRGTPIPDLPPDGRSRVEEELARIREEEGEEPSPDRVHKAELAEAKRRTDAMRRLMTDQLVECRYNEVMFRLIHELCKYGTGVMKGPVREWRRRGRWTSGKPGDWRLSDRENAAPVFVPVHVWDFFPDPDATSGEDMEWCFELHRWSHSDLRRFGPELGFDERQLRHLLRERPRMGAPYHSFIRQLHEFERGEAERQHSRFYLSRSRI